MSAHRLSDHFRAVHSTCNEIFVLCLHNAAKGVVIIINNITTSRVLQPKAGQGENCIWICFNQASKALLTCLNTCEPSSKVIVSISHEDVLQSLIDL